MNVPIVLVNPPFFDVQRPSIALGLLKEILNRNGLETRVVYANLLYAEHVGLSIYQRIIGERAENAIGDWIFSTVAFPEAPNNPSDYLERLRLVQTKPYPSTGDAHDNSWLLDLRTHAIGFIDAIVERIVSLGPRIVGCTSSFGQHVAALAILRRLRERRPDIATVLGGANCESIMGLTTHRNFRWVDYVVSGEAESLIVPLCTALLRCDADTRPDNLPYGVLGPAQRDDEYRGQSTEKTVPRASITDINSIPAPNYDDYFTALAESSCKGNILPTLPMESSRGCWWGQVSHCTFCGLNGVGMAFRSKCAEVVLTQMDEMVQRYGINRIEMVDNILDHRYFDTLLPVLANPPRDYSIFYEVKSNLTRSQVALLMQAGVHAIQPGIESLDSRVLKTMKKGVSAWQNIRLLKWARQYGLKVYWQTIFGFPDEEDFWYEETARVLPALFHLQPGGCTRLRYDRFSPYHINQKAFGLDLEPYWQFRQVYPLDAVELKNQAYFFVDLNNASNAEIDESLLARPGLQRYIDICNTWFVAWKRRPRPVCTLFERDGETYLCDTRPAFATEVRKVDALTQQILQAADNGVSATDLIREVAQSCEYSVSTVECEVANLIDTGLILDIDARLLSLALRAPVRRFNREALPLGRVNVPRHEEKCETLQNVH